MGETVYLKIRQEDPSVLKKKIKEAGGKWNYQLRVWEVDKKKVKELGLLNRIYWKYS